MWKPKSNSLIGTIRLPVSLSPRPPRYSVYMYIGTSGWGGGGPTAISIVVVCLLLYLRYQYTRDLGAYPARQYRRICMGSQAPPKAGGCLCIGALYQGT